MTRSQTYTETEEQIFDAALKVFSRKGQHGARMQEIAVEAGINQALLHYYFRSKEKLYTTVFTHVFEEFMSAARAPFEEDLPFDRLLEAFIDRFMSIHAAHPEISRLWVLENLSGAPVAGPILREQMRTNPNLVPNLFIARIQKAIDDGEVRKVDPFQTFVTLLGASVFFFLAFPMLSTVNPTLAKDKEAAVNERKKHLFDILYNGLEKK
jgi:AcrR family transcriptional regulator